MFNLRREAGHHTLRKLLYRSGMRLKQIFNGKGAKSSYYNPRSACQHDESGGREVIYYVTEISK